MPFCRVPSPEFSQAPEYPQLTHQCRFAVRSRAHVSLRGFSWKCFQSLRGTWPLDASTWRSAAGFAWLPPALANRDVQHPDDPQHSVPPSLHMHGQGILTLLPSATLLSLALGTDSPCSDERRAGNLGFSASGLFTRFNVTHVNIRTSGTSSGPPGPPSQACRTLPYH